METEKLTPYLYPDLGHITKTLDRFANPVVPLKAKQRFTTQSHASPHPSIRDSSSWYHPLSACLPFRTPSKPQVIGAPATDCLLLLYINCVNAPSRISGSRATTRSKKCIGHRRMGQLAFSIPSTVPYTLPFRLEKLPTTVDNSFWLPPYFVWVHLNSYICLVLFFLPSPI